MDSFKTFISCFFLLLCTNLWPQSGIQTQSDLGIEELIKDVFIKGSCRNVSNITSLGDENISIGQFVGGEGSININDGIILSTGNIELAHGPNLNNESTFSFDSISVDPDLRILSTSTLYDVTGIEFDFVPLNSRVTFKYVFASEEYCEFVGTAFNDVFGFFVSGPGINGNFENDAINVATLQGSNDDVSINTINHLLNEQFYVNNATNINSTGDCGITEAPAAPQLIAYDGYTVPLTASFQVIPCETYHIRLVIGDVGDDLLDSAVFLETNSFDLGEPISIRAEVPGTDGTVAYEDCVDGQFVFTRSAFSNINEELIIDYSISSESEASNGIDFTEIPMRVTIPAGEPTFTLPINIINDNIIEGPESIKLELMYDCDCIDPVLSELTINEASELSMGIENILVCVDQPFNLSPVLEGGVPPYSILWDTGEESDTLIATISSSRNYQLTVTDFCGNTIIGESQVGIQDIPIASLIGDFNFCDIQEIGIPITLEGSPPWDIEYSIDGVEQDPIENIFTNPFFIDTPTVGRYEILTFSDANCTGDIEGSANVESTFSVEVDAKPPTCFNSSDGSIELTHVEAVAPFTIEWGVPSGNDLLLDNLPEGNYTLQIIDADGCIYKQNYDLIALSDNSIECTNIFIPNVFSPNGDGINDVFTIFLDSNSEVESVLSLQVYNRWGNLVYEQNNFVPDNGRSGWQGDYRGEPLNADVFVYKLIVSYRDGTNQLLSGDVSLLR